MYLRVELVDGHLIVREGVKALLAQRSDMELVAEAASGAEGLRQAVRLHPDVLVLDPALSDMDGVEVIRHLAADLPETRVLVLADEWDGSRVRSVLAAGATGFLGKDCSFGELAEAIRTVAGGRPYLGRGIADALGREDAELLVLAAPKGPFLLEPPVHDALLKAVFENTTDAVFVKDLKGRYLLINRAGAAMLGKTVAEVVGRTDDELIPAETAAEFAAVDAKACAEGEASAEVCMEVAGTRRTVLATLGGYRGSDGELIGLFGIARDITERKLVESELAAYQKQLSVMAAVKVRAEGQQRQKIAAALHDQIGQSLALAKIGLEQLEGQGGGSEELEQEIRRIRDLIDFAIKQTRSLTLELSPPALHELGLRAALASLCEEFAERHRIEVHFRGGGNKRQHGFSDDLRALLFQGVRELLVNVVKHARASRAEVVLERDEDSIRVRVRDDGKGIGLGEIPGSSLVRSGFGLFSLKKRIRSYGGTLEIDSAPGAGTTVTLTVPFSGKASPAK